MLETCFDFSRIIFSLKILNNFHNLKLVKKLNKQKYNSIKITNINKISWWCSDEVKIRKIKKVIGVCVLKVVEQIEMSQEK